LSVPGGSSSTDGFIARYSSNLSLLTVQDWGTGLSNAEVVNGIAVHGNTPIMVGYFWASGTFIGGPQTNLGQADGLVTRAVL